MSLHIRVHRPAGYRQRQSSARTCHSSILNLVATCGGKGICWHCASRLDNHDACLDARCMHHDKNFLRFIALFLGASQLGNGSATHILLHQPSSCKSVLLNPNRPGCKSKSRHLQVVQRLLLQNHPPGNQTQTAPLGGAQVGAREGWREGKREMGLGRECPLQACK